RGEVETEFPLVGSTIGARILWVRQLPPRPRGRRQTVARGGGMREGERARRIVQGRRDINIEAEVGKPTEQQAAVCPRNPLRIERPIQRSRLAPPSPCRVDRVHLERAVA